MAREQASARPLISVVIPTRRDECVTTTMDTLRAQTIQDLEIHVVVDADGRGAPWARNRGAELARGEYLLFSDNDVEWEPDALELMLRTLREAEDSERASPGGRPPRWRTAYAYGGYTTPGIGEQCMREWDWAALRAGNFISTMSLISRSCWDETGMRWDESLRRFQDFDVWLRFGFAGFKGVWVRKILFYTAIRPGITYGSDAQPLEEALAIVRRKYGLRS